MEIHPSPHSRDGHFRRRSCGHYDHLPVDPIGPATFKDLHPPRIRRCLERDSIAVRPNLFTRRVLQAIGPSTRRNRKQNQNPQDCHETSIIPMCAPKRKGGISRFFAEEATSQAPPHDSGTTAMRTRLQVPAGVPLQEASYRAIRFPLAGSTRTRRARGTAHVHGKDYGYHRRSWRFQDLQLWAEWLQADGVLKHDAKAKIAKSDPLAPVRDSYLEESFEQEAIAAIGRHLLRGTACDLVRWWRENVMPSVSNRASYQCNPRRNSPRAAFCG